MNPDTATTESEAPERWVAYRPEIKILDCTIRDGGLINDHGFGDDFARSVYNACVAAGVDYIEIGYKASKRIYSPAQFGAWKFCDEDALRRITGDTPAPGTKISVMADAERTDYKQDILPKKKSVIDCIRVACYIHQVPMALDMLQDARDKGYDTMLQLMAVSVIPESELNAALELAAHSVAEAVYLVDSFGALYSEQVHNLISLYLKHMQGTGKEIGFHGHNNQQLAFANTIEAIVAGANRLDATINGIGRGAGNCPMELLIGFLHNPKFQIRPILQCCRDTIMPLSRDIEWGYRVPYAITGRLNQHPRPAIKFRSGPTPDDYVAFYDQMVEEE
ncbi:MAG: aldolase catalytic domain-containing protein [Lentisphaerae bacterium]|nr:aldolase catalytic domain-containing protein [Lentisphaerota bacterium]